MSEKLASELTLLLKDISEEAPCGEALVDNSYEYQAIEGKISKVDSDTAKRASLDWRKSEWNSVQTEVQGFLDKTKDIRIFSLYTKIIINTEKEPVKALAKGLMLIHHCIENYWDCLYPSIDSDDPDEAYFDRSNALADFADYSYLIKPLSTDINVLNIGIGEYTLEDLVTFDGNGVVSGKQPLLGLMPEEEEQYQQVIEYFNLSLNLAESIKKIYHEKSGEFFSEFDKYLLPMLKKGSILGGGDPSSLKESNGNASVSPDVVIAPQGISSRDDIRKSIDLICEYYEEHEPSSPVPMILQRAKRMVEMDYREIFSELELGANSALDKLFGKNDGSSS